MELSASDISESYARLHPKDPAASTPETETAPEETQYTASGIPKPRQQTSDPAVSSAYIRKVAPPERAFDVAKHAAIYTLVQDEPPERQRELIAAARQTEVPLAIAAVDRDRVMEIQRLDTLKRNIEGANVLTEYVGQELSFAAVRDVVEEMGTAEKQARSVARGWDIGTFNLRRGHLGAQLLAGIELTEEEWAETVTPNFGLDLVPGYGEGIVQSGLESAPNMLEMTAGAVVLAAPSAALTALATGGNPAAIITAAGISGRTGAAAASFVFHAGDSYLDLLELRDADGNGLDPEAAKGIAVIVGGVNAGLEVFGLNMLAKGMPGLSTALKKLTGEGLVTMAQDPIGKRLLKRLAKASVRVGGSVAGETITEILQEIVKYSGEHVLDTPEGGDVIVEDMDIPAVARKASQAAIMYAGGGATIVEGFGAKRDIDAAIANGQALIDLRDRLVETGLPVDMQEGFVRDIEESSGGQAIVTTPVDNLLRLFQANDITPAALAEISPELAAEVTVAAATGTDATVSITDLAVHLGGMEGFETLVEDIRLGQLNPTIREAQAAPAKLRAKIAGELAAAETAFESEDLTLYNSLLDTLSSDLLMTQDASEANAELIATVLSTAAARGVLPETGADLLERMGVTFSREGVNPPREGETARVEQAPDQPEAVVAQAALHAVERADHQTRLPEAPESDKIHHKAVGIAQRYVEAAGREYTPPLEYAPIDKARGARIAEEFELMLNDPHNPEVAASYDAMINETLAQYEAILAETGLVVTFMGPEDTYYVNPREVIVDVVENNHMLVFPTLAPGGAFGSDPAFDVTQNPLVRPTEFTDSRGTPMVANDIFRVVHDYFGHIKHGNGFRARGEENAWQAHASMYSDLARRAMTTETRGQNSWVNFGPNGKANQTATAEDTVFADQKIGLMPVWVSEDGRQSARARRERFQRDRAAGETGFEGAIDEFGNVELVHWSRARFTRTDGSLWGQGLSRNVHGETARRQAGAPPRTFFGIESTVSDGYRKELGLGSIRNVARVPGELIYFVNPFRGGRNGLNFDPDNLWDSSDLVATELAIKAAGYIGYAINNQQLGKVVQIYDDIPVSQDGNGRLYQSANPLRDTGPAKDQTAEKAAKSRRRRILRTLGLDIESRPKTRAVAAALETRQRKLAGTIDRHDQSDEAVSKIARWMTQEVMFELAHPESSGVGWYTDRYQRALDIMGEAFPELLTDVNKRATFTALMAIASDGQKVGPNALMAVDYYANYRDTGKFTTSRGHQRMDSIDKHVAVLQELIDLLGEEGTKDHLLKTDTVSALAKDAKAQGRKFDTAYQAHMTLPRAAVEFGPKLGAFYANLMGEVGYLTMDRWWSRTFNRYRGVILQQPSEVGMRRFAELIGLPDLSNDEVLSAIIEPQAAYDARNFKTRLALLMGSSQPTTKKEAAAWIAAAREKAGEDFDVLYQEHQVERASNTIFKAAFIELEDAPYSATDRTFMVKAAKRTAANLRRRGHPTTVADIQAILWYYEKKLYGELGAVQTAKESFEEALDRAVQPYRDRSGGRTVQGTGRLEQAGTVREVGQDEFGEPRRGVTERVPEIQVAAQQFKDGKITAVEFRAIIDEHKPVTEYATVPRPSTIPAMKAAFSAGKSTQKLDKLGAPRKLADGHPVAVRLDIPAYRDHGTWIVTVHEQKASFAPGATIGYDSVARITDVTFGVTTEKVALGIAIGANKGTIATMKGDWVGVKPMEAKALADAALKEPKKWRQVGMDPERRSSFYERGTMKPIESAKEVIQIGPLVLARGVVFQDHAALYQLPGEDPRGYLDVGENFLDVTLTGRADMSTLQHEMGHVYLQILQAMELDGSASPQQMWDLALLREELGLAPDEVFSPATRDAHELFARLHEAYLRDGRAPTPELQSVFERFSAWMQSVYRSIRQLLSEDEQLNDELRGVFDRLYATEEALAEVQEGLEAIDLSAIANPEQTAGLRADWDRLVSEAQRQAREKAMRDYRGSQRKEYRQRKKQLTDRARSEYVDLPAVKVANWLKTGETDLELPEQVKGLKLHRRSVLQTLGVTKLPPLLRGKATVIEGGVDPEVVARLFGYPDALAMLTDIAGAPTQKAAIAETVDPLMTAEFGEMRPNDTTQMAELAQQAWQNRERATYLHNVLKSLTKHLGAGDPRTMARLAKAEAEARVANVKMAQLSPIKYRRAERQHHLDAVAAAAAADYEAALVSTYKQLINHHMARAATEAKEEFEKKREQLKKWGRLKNRQKLGKIRIEGKKPFLVAQDGLMFAVDLDRVSYKKLMNHPMLEPIPPGTMAGVASAVKLIEDNDQSAAIELSDALLEERAKLNYRQMTPKQFRDLFDAVKSLNHVATQWNKLRIAGQLWDLDETATEIAESIDENAQIRQKSYTGSIGDQDKGVKHFFMTMMDGLRGLAIRPEVITTDMDGGKPGRVHEILFAPFRAAGAEKLALVSKVTPRAVKAVQDIERELKGRGAIMFMGKRIQAIELVGIALNMGTESNAYKFIEGWKTAESADGAFQGFPGMDESTTVQDVIAALENAGLTPRLWDLVQDIWDTIEILQAPSFEVADRATGVRPPAVPAVEIVLFGGRRLRGGYYPMAYDTGFATVQARIMGQYQAEGLAFDQPLVRKNVDKGFTESRTSFVAPVRMDLGALFEHLEEVAHYTTHYDAVTANWKLLHHAKVQNAIESTYGKQAWEALEHWVQHTARNGRPATADIALKVADPLLRETRTTLTVMTFGARPGLWFDQLTGVFTAFGTVRPGIALKGITNAIANMQTGMAFQESELLSGRKATWSREVADMHARRDSRTEGPRAARRNKISMALMMPTGWFQLVVDHITWHVGRAEAIADGITDQAAIVRRADAKVTLTQGGGGLIDLAAVQRGGQLSKALTMYLAILLQMQNILWMYKQIATREGVSGVGKFAYMAAIGVLAPAVISGVMKGDEPEADEPMDWAKWLTLLVMESTVGGVPVIGEVPAMFLSDISGNPITALTLIEKDVRGMNYLYQLISGEKDLDDFTEGQLGAMVALIGTFSAMYGIPLPVSQIADMTYQGMNPEKKDRALLDTIFGVPYSAQ